MWLRKIQGGTSIGPYEWPEDGSVAEVPDRFGQELLAIPESGFEKVGGPEPENAITEPGPVATITEGSTPDGDVNAAVLDMLENVRDDGGSQEQEAVKPARKGRAAKTEDSGTPA